MRLPLQVPSLQADQDMGSALLLFGAGSASVLQITERYRRASQRSGQSTGAEAMTYCNDALQRSVTC